MLFSHENLANENPAFVAPGIQTKLWLISQRACRKMAIISSENQPENQVIFGVLWAHLLTF